MKKYLLSCFFLFAFKATSLPVGWLEIEKTAVKGEELEVFFFDYTSKLYEVAPDIEKYKERQFTNKLEEVQFQFPAYAAKRNVKGEDSVIYYILRPDKSKMDQPFYFNLEIVKTGKSFALESLEYKSNYQDHILKTVPAPTCRGSLISGYMSIIQDSPRKKELIGNGFRLTDSIFTRVLPYSEVRKPFYKLIEINFQ